MNNRAIKIQWSAITLALLIGIFFWRRSQSTAGSSASVPIVTIRDEEHLGSPNSRATTFIAAYSTPIVFFGKVVDELGNVISGASIKLGVHDNPAGTGSYYYRTSDSAGLFELSGVHGLGISIWVSKAGYYTIESSRGRHFVYGGFRGPHDGVNPTDASPAVFVLKKMGEVASLVHLAKTSVKVPKDGTPVEIDLSTGRVVSTGVGDLRFEVWTADRNSDPNSGRNYEWECRVSIPGGGLIDRTGEFEFQAPEAGYLSSFETGMAQNAIPWRKGFEHQFFAKLRNGRFARLSLELTTAGDHFFVLDCYLNPTPGDRNLVAVPENSAPAR